MRKFALMLVALLALAAIVAGCGGGGSSSSSSSDSSTAAGGESESSDSGSSSSGDSGGKAPTKAVFIREADKVCGEADAELTEEITEYAKENGISVSGEEEPSEEQQLEILHAVVFPNLARQAEEIAALTPPAGEEETVEDITDTLSEEVKEAEEADGVPDESTLEGASKKAKAYGLTTCGS